MKLFFQGPMSSVDVELTHATQVPALRQQAKGDSHGGRGGKTSEVTGLTRSGNK